MDWQSEFLRLFMSDTKEDHSAALTLKQEHIPEKLYRYRPLSSAPYIIDEICTGEIYLANPNELNDPFDSCSLLKSEQPSYYFTDQDSFRNSLQSHFSDEFLSQVFRSEDWYNELMWLVAKESMPPEKQELAVNALVQAVMKQLLDVNKSFNHIIHDTSRLACFTTKSDNLPMWNHYAQSHTGVCLEYEPKIVDNVYIINRLFPVYYTDVLPDMLERSLGRGKLEFSILDYFLIHKLKDWAYENEWRLIYNVGSWYFSYEKVPKEFWTQGKKIKFIQPSRVLLGAKINKAYEKLIRDACGHYNIEVAKMQCTEYGLRES